MTWKEDMRAIGRKARRAETIEEAARDTMDLARRQRGVVERIRILRAWYDLRNRANYRTAPAWEDLLADLPPEERTPHILSALETGEPSIMAAAHNLLRIHARPEDVPSVLRPVLEGAQNRKEEVAGVARATLTRLGELDPSRLDETMDALWDSKRQTDHLLATLLLRTPAARARLDHHIARFVDTYRSAHANGRLALAKHLATHPVDEDGFLIVRRAVDAIRRDPELAGTPAEPAETVLDEVTEIRARRKARQGARAA